ncbi:serine hydrolase, partial [Streptomyces sp. NPDC004290]
PYDTASIIKVDIHAALLLQAQDAGRPLDATQQALARAMIEHSDNAAANALWRQIGLAPGLEAANKRLGLTSTKGGPGFLWGLTRTTASDQIRLLRLRARSRRIVALATGATDEEIERALTATGGEVKDAILTILAGVDGPSAARLLAENGGHLRAALDDAAG